jgi:hypothetical protein
MVSSFGRIKRLRYETIYKNGAFHIKEEKIIKPEIRWHFNHYKKDYSAYLSGSPIVAGYRYNFSLARLVHCTFNKAFDYHDPFHVVFYKDGDSFNIRPSNLQSATLSEKQKRIKDLGRSPNPFHKLSKEQIHERHWQMLRFHLKKITQFSATGKEIQTFNSIADAHRATGCNATGISRNAKGYLRSCGGYQWT